MGLFSRRSRVGEALDVASQTNLGAEGGWVAAVVSAIALLFSCYSVYETTLRQPELRVFVPPLIQYSSPYNNSNFEVFAVPVTISNSGAREGTVLSLELEVTNPRTKQAKHFYSADIGRWRMEDVRNNTLQPFVPIALSGKSSASASILFYARDTETVQQIVTDTGDYEFTLSLKTLVNQDLGALDKALISPPKDLHFTMELPVYDARAFIEGTLALHSKDWAAVSGKVQ